MAQRIWRDIAASSKEIVEAVLQLYDRIVNQRASCAKGNDCGVSCDCSGCSEEGAEAAGFICGYRGIGKAEKKGGGTPKRKTAAKSHFADSKEIRKNAVLKGTNFLEGATMKERNNQVGGHRA